MTSSPAIARSTFLSVDGDVRARGTGKNWTKLTLIAAALKKIGLDATRRKNLHFRRNSVEQK
jgi:hypothetical protein